MHRVSGLKYEDDYMTTLHKATAPLLDKRIRRNMCSLVIAGGRVSNLPLLGRGCSWSLGGFMEELGRFEKSKRLVIGVYILNDDVSTLVLNISPYIIHTYFPHI